MLATGLRNGTIKLWQGGNVVAVAAGSGLNEIGAEEYSNV
jgi:hypothetical protein